MSDEPLLTELCMVCHIKPYRYCCPRCSSRTCSLPCLKRHKQWASCNGARDPATYVKRSDLATPKGIDHDYNYLTSIERQFDLAERDCESRGILLYDEVEKGGRKRAHKITKGEVPLGDAIRERRIVVDRAPKGMSRQKQNATFWDRRAKRIVWTVEWVHKNGSREIGQCPDTEPINKVYAKMPAPKGIQTSAEAGMPRKKLKTYPEVPKPPVPTTISAPEQLRPASTPQVPPEQLRTLELLPPPVLENQHLEILQTDPIVNKPTPPPPQINQESPPTIHFYLLLPSTPTSYRVLIPLAPTDTLSEALTDRLVLEFPTIYALKQSPDKLPTGFMTEEEYLKSIAQRGNMDTQLDGLLGADGGWENGGAEGTNPDVDEGALRDVLKKDLVKEVEVG